MTFASNSSSSIQLPKMPTAWTEETWLNATPAECYKQSQDVTMPAAAKLVEFSGILHRAQQSLKILDNGAGMGQVTEALITGLGKGGIQLEITCGDVDDGLLAELEGKNERSEWSNVQVQKIDAINMVNTPDKTFDYVFGNFLYFLISDPQAALKETLRVLQPGGTLAFTTWALSGPFQLLQLAQAHLIDYPLVPPPGRLFGAWNHPRYVKSQLQELGYTNIEITPYTFTHSASGAAEMARKMWLVLMLYTMGWGEERKHSGWELGQAVEKSLKLQQGEGRVEITSVALLVQAQRPTEG